MRFLNSPRNDTLILGDKVEGSCGDSDNILIRLISFYFESPQLPSTIHIINAIIPNSSTTWY